MLAVNVYRFPFAKNDACIENDIVQFSFIEQRPKLH